MCPFKMEAFQPPPWLPIDPEPPGRTALVVSLCTVLSKPGALVSLVAGPGTGATTAAGAVATRMARRLPVCVARLAGGADVAHIFHTIGHALGSPFPRDQSAVCEALSEAGPILLVLDDADAPGTETVVERLSAVAPEARFLAVGRRAVLMEHVVSMPALDDGQALARARDIDAGAEPPPANLVLARLRRGCGPSGEDPWGFLVELPPAADLLAAFMGGVPGAAPVGVPGDLLLFQSAGRVAMRRSVAEALRARRPRSDAELAEDLHPRCAALLRVAEEPSLIGKPDPRDMPLLRHLAAHHPDTDVASRAAAAWSRFQVAAGHTSTARVWRSRERSDFDSGLPAARLAWAEGDALLSDGEQGEALVAYEIAATQLRRERATALLGGLHRRCADRLLGREELAAAEEHLEEALAITRSLGDSLGLALSLRSLACLRIAQGVEQEAEQELDRACELLTPLEHQGVLPSSLRLARAELALVQGRPDAAEVELQQALLNGSPQPLEQADHARLLADLALRRGQLEVAEQQVERALSFYGQAGERACLAAAHRLLGDVAALRGQPLLADARYQRATREHVRAADMRGLARTLAHRATLERELGDGQVADDLDRLLRAVESLLGPGPG